MSEREAPPQLQKEYALGQLRELLGRAHRMGNDSGESKLIAGIIQAVENGEMSADEAVTRAQGILDAKNEV